MSAVAKRKKKSITSNLEENGFRIGETPMPFVADPKPLLLPEAMIDLRTAEAPAAPKASFAPECPQCGSRFTPVDRTRPVGKGTGRWRKCVHCGKEFKTREIVVGES